MSKRAPLCWFCGKKKVEDREHGVCGPCTLAGSLIAFSASDKRQAAAVATAYAVGMTTYAETLFWTKLGT